MDSHTLKWLSPAEKLPLGLVERDRSVLTMHWSSFVCDAGLFSIDATGVNGRIRRFDSGVGSSAKACGNPHE